MREAPSARGAIVIVLSQWTGVLGAMSARQLINFTPTIRPNSAANWLKKSARTAVMDGRWSQVGLNECTQCLLRSSIFYWIILIHLLLSLYALYAIVVVMRMYGRRISPLCPHRNTKFKLIVILPSFLMKFFKIGDNIILFCWFVFFVLFFLQPLYPTCYPADMHEIWHECVFLRIVK